MKYYHLTDCRVITRDRIQAARRVSLWQRRTNT